MSEEQDKTFIKAVNIGGNRTTKEIEGHELDKIFIGGYTSWINKLEDYQRKKYDYSKHLLTAGVLPDQPTMIIDGKEVDVRDIVAKSAIPYPTPLKRRFLNAVETDQVVSRVLDLFTIFLFETGRKSALRPVGYYRTKNIDEFTEMLNKIVSPELQEKQINFCDNVDTYSHVWETFAPHSFLQSLIFGTGGFFKELMNTESIENKDFDINIPIGTPTILKHLDSFYFEKMYMNRKSFKPLLLEYSDTQYTLIDDDIYNNSDVPEGVKNEFVGWKSMIMRDPDVDYEKKNLLLPLNQMVIFRNGISTAPNLQFFGKSRIFPVLVISELQREIHYNILPDVNKIQSRGSGLLTTKMKNEIKLNTLVDSLEAGSNYIVSNATDLNYQTIAINVNIPALEEQRFNNVKHILMGLNFPSPFLNFEGTTNRDTVRLIAEFYKNTTIESMRNSISNAMADQWYLPLIMFFFNNIVSGELDGNKKEQGKYNFIDLKLKIITEFENIDFAVFEEKLEALNNITYLTDQEKREHVGEEPYPINDERTEGVETLNKKIKEIEDVQRRQQGSVPEDANKEVTEIREQAKEVKVRSNGKQQTE